MNSIFAPGLLAGQHALVTGGGSGINQRIAERFAQQGARVSLVGRNSHRLDDAARSITEAGGQAEGFSADVRDVEALSGSITAACERFGQLDIVVAGAAGNFVAEANAMSANGFRTVVDIDLLGTFNTFRQSYPKLRRPGARLLAVSAVQASLPTATQAHVCSAKAGVEMLVRCLAIEWGPEGVRCNAISPGPLAETEGMQRLAPGVTTARSAFSRLCH